MTEIITPKSLKSELEIASASYYQRWRLIKDRMARYAIVVGGWAIIVAIVLIFFYLLYVVVPLFIPATAQSVANYRLPGDDKGKTLMLAMEEQNEIGVRLTDQGEALFFNVKTGQIILDQRLAIPANTKLKSFAAQSGNEGAIAYGLEDGRMLVAKHHYEITYPNNVRTIKPAIIYPLEEPVVMIDPQGAALDKVAVAIAKDETTLVAATAHKLFVVGLTRTQSLFGEGKVERTVAELELPVQNIAHVLIDQDQHNLYLASEHGELTQYDIRDKSAPVLKQQLTLIPAGHTITSLTLLNGGLSLLVGDSSGEVSQWSKVRNEQNLSSIIKLRSFKVSDRRINFLVHEQRRKGFLTVDQQGTVNIFNTTAERELLNLPQLVTQPVAFTVAPRANAFLIQSADDQLHFWKVDNEHPEVSFKSIWRKVWYESYPKPDFIWQSSSSNSDFEPKYSLTPLVFGTLKAAFYAMLFAIPLSLMGAMYAAYFMAPGMRNYVKPTIELMGALPTVILGFLAGLWLAPFLEENLLGIFLTLLLLPLGVMSTALAWQYLPKTVRINVPDGMEALVLIPVIISMVWLTFALSPGLERFFFNGDLKAWLNSEYGISYDQRNSLVVGIAMGFAVIPTIFTIAEDAIFSVPKHLTVGSLALGATPWQTMIRVVLLTASPGIFSAVMIGLGRAIGETMIVLMATGNTPVMDMSIFEGMRTLAANVAVEMPESEVNSTHYRVLFLAALMLFMFTFIFNTLAEVIRQRLREKYSSL